MVATRSKDVAFEVLLAGSGVTGEQILYEQAATLAQSQGATAEQIAQGRALQERVVRRPEVGDGRGRHA